ncbi:rhodanese-like domain-containing protein [Clostridium sporogenes]|uniref:rhodanese-like domain-containing protein n=1 Tax=Clostridium sporogenes TaxID=1509 RepID=UPI0013D6409E|nr:sulfurtransferase [Clostridium sporogenes]
MKKNFKGIVLLLFGIMMFTLIGCTSNQKTEKKEESTSLVKEIKTDELKKNITSKEWVVLDTRSNDAFNGWKLDGVKRGGHIKGATDFSANWLKVEDTEKNKEKRLEEALKNKGITKDKNVVLYDANGKDSEEVAKYLNKKGITKLYKYDVKKWAEDDKLAMESYPNYQMLVPASWVNDLINNKKPETFKGDKYKVFEVSWGDESKAEDYKKGHIKGAVHMNTDEVEKGPVWNRLPDKDLEKFAKNNGITADTTVVLYGADSMPSFRVAAILKYMGVKDVRVLNGGTATWTSAGYELDTTSNKKTPVDSFGAAVPLNKGYIVDLPEAKEILKDKEGSKLVDIRSWDEFTGKISGYDYIKAKGRPAGAVWGHAGSDSSHLEDFRNVDNTMRNSSEILAMWEKEGIKPDQRLSFYCGTGWRAAEVLIYADVMGLKNISLYDGGWNEWSANKNNPIEVGEPSKK